MFCDETQVAREVPVRFKLPGLCLCKQSAAASRLYSHQVFQGRDNTGGIFKKSLIQTRDFGISILAGISQHPNMIMFGSTTDLIGTATNRRLSGSWF